MCLFILQLEVTSFYKTFHWKKFNREWRKFCYKMNALQLLLSRCWGECVEEVNNQIMSSSVPLPARLSNTSWCMRHVLNGNNENFTTVQHKTELNRQVLPEPTTHRTFHSKWTLDIFCAPVLLYHTFIRIFSNAMSPLNSPIEWWHTTNEFSEKQCKQIMNKQIKFRSARNQNGSHCFHLLWMWIQCDKIRRFSTVSAFTFQRLEPFLKSTNATFYQKYALVNCGSEIRFHNFRPFQTSPYMSV